MKMPTAADGEITPASAQDMVAGNCMASRRQALRLRGPAGSEQRKEDPRRRRRRRNSA